MGKILLVVVITFSDKPTELRGVRMPDVGECYKQAAVLAKAPPVDEDVVKYFIGCSFEEPMETKPM